MCTNFWFDVGHTWMAYLNSENSLRYGIKGNKRGRHDWFGTSN